MRRRGHGRGRRAVSAGGSPRDVEPARAVRRFSERAGRGSYSHRDHADRAGERSAAAPRRPFRSGSPPRRSCRARRPEEEYNEQHSQDVAVGVDPDQYADTDPSALTDFRPALDPYGSWVDDPNYGTVWTPSASVVGDDFAPYVSGGHWAYDDANNWTWVSGYDWGWAPFHYGRWAYLGTRWGWIPGREYSGAWVTWRQGYGAYNGYLGWAPIPPRWGWRNGGAFGFGFATQAPYAFCGVHDIFGGNLGAKMAVGGQVGAIGAHSVPVAREQRRERRTQRGRARRGAPDRRRPVPGSVGISPSEVAHAPVNNRGVMHAQQFARPSSAQALGAHAAMGSTEATPPSARSSGVTGHSRNEAIAQAPQYRGSPAGPHYFPSHAITGDTRGTAAPTTAPATAAGTTHLPRTAAATATMALTPATPATAATRVTGAGAWSTRGSGGIHLAVPEHPLPTTTTTVRSSTTAAAASGAGGGGGFRGGGGRGARRRRASLGPRRDPPGARHGACSSSHPRE